ncbi:polyphosphate kinase [Pelagivirga sediminicola]|uniref:Polyphosphate kinase n=1 Tax=Pelagivirga sediminicola TaxID=2170575 RepID=A0A2T7GCG0_9RHOB|nr:VOC family protein [Pelagivirga sediminicola]PVA12103.1 polyphosphate kinase [Pelagivirga sediminicola]
MLKLDHIAVAATNLEEGADWVHRALDAAPGPGGQHAHFGTHNRLLGLEDGLYLEVIAVDPAAPPLPYARWFDLDRFSGPPRIGNWICRTDDLEGAQAALPGIGAQVPLERGDLRWRMAVPENGQLPFDDCHPAVIQWDCARHPAASLARSGIALRRLIVSHPQAEDLRARLAPLLTDDRVVYVTGPAALRAEFDTPDGPRDLG